MKPELVFNHGTISLQNDFPVTENEGAWVVPAVATLEGVQNGGLKVFDNSVPVGASFEDGQDTDAIKDAVGHHSGLRDMAHWMNGKPFTPGGHPEDNEQVFGVSSVGQVSGKLDDAHADDEGRRVLVNVHLFKGDERNQRIIDDLSKGSEVDVSIGFFTHVIPASGSFGGEEFNRIETDVLVDHLARVLEGACSFSDGCGLGRGDLLTSNPSHTSANDSCSGCSRRDSCKKPQDERSGCTRNNDENTIKIPIEVTGADEAVTSLDKLAEKLNNINLNMLGKRFNLFSGDKAVPAHTSPKAPENQPWEFRQGDYTIEQLTNWSAWIADKPKDELTKADTKLPHHDLNGNVVLRGVQAAVGAMSGARGGVDIPPRDRRGVLRHLERHLRQFDRELPDGLNESSSHDKTTKQEVGILTDEKQAELEKQIAELTQENSDLQGKKEAEANELQEAQDKVKAFEEAEEAKVNKQREELIEGILATGTDIDKEVLESMNKDMLETVLKVKEDAVQPDRNPLKMSSNDNNDTYGLLNKENNRFWFNDGKKPFER